MKNSHTAMICVTFLSQDESHRPCNFMFLSVSFRSQSFMILVNGKHDFSLCRKSYLFSCEKLEKYKKTLHSHKIDLLDTKKEKKLNFKTDTLCPSFRYLNTNFLWELGFNLS